MKIEKQNKHKYTKKLTKVDNTSKIIHLILRHRKCAPCSTSPHSLPYYSQCNVAVCLIREAGSSPGMLKRGLAVGTATTDHLTLGFVCLYLINVLMHLCFMGLMVRLYMPLITVSIYNGARRRRRPWPCIRVTLAYASVACQLSYYGIN